MSALNSTFETARPRSARSPARRALGAATYGALMLPMGVAAIGTGMTGHTARLLGFERRMAGRLADEPFVNERKPGAPRVLVHGLATVMLGFVGLVLFGFIAAFIFRGLLYGVDVGGPYDDAWGGPSRTGAWAVHFLVSLPIAVFAVFALRGLATLHARLASRLQGATVGAWVTPVAGLSVAVSTVFFIAWLQQI